MIYQPHKVADLFPMMNSESYTELRDDIEANGLCDPGVLTLDNQIIDGRNRYKACLELGREMQWNELDTEDEAEILEYAISKNLNRRHLTASQRAMIAAKLAKLQLGDNQHSEGGQICPPSIEDASCQLKVSKGSTKSAKKVIADGAPEVIQAVEQGELPVSKAADLVKQVPDKAEQATILKRGPKAVAEVTVKPQVVSHFRLFKEVWDKADEIGQAAIRSFVLNELSE